MSLKSNYKPPKKQIFIEYESVYKKIEELKNIIQIDIIEQSTVSKKNELEALENMSGETNDALMNFTSSNFTKIQSMAVILNQILKYIETSAKYFEYEDNQLNRNIKLKQGD